MTDTVHHPNVEERIQTIVSTIRAEERRLRDKHAILEHQDAIGLGIMLVSLFGMIGSGWLYFSDLIPAWLCIVVSSIFAAFSHELEHDLIHHQYFRKNRFLHNTMMLAVWVMRPNTVNPWYRRGMHLLHHRVSGTEKDLEERLVGNGIAYGLPVRYLVMFDGLLGMLARRSALKRDIAHFSVSEVLNAAFPFAVLYFGGWYVFLAFHGYDAIWGPTTAYATWLLEAMAVIDFLVVVLVAPNFIRSASLNFVTSAMHYYGGVTNLIQQTQVLNAWFFAPLHLFCFNFGSTHAIHHFVVGQPFYIRQMVARAAHRVMRENGVRFNDFNTFGAANRYQPG
jgi:fatty acid desaturase